MRIQLRDDTDDVARSKQRDKVLHQLELSLQQNDREKIHEAMHQFLEDWRLFAKKRQTMAEFHLEQLKTLILPTQVSTALFSICSFTGSGTRSFHSLTELQNEWLLYTQYYPFEG